MDRGEVEVDEDRQARVKSAPVLPTDRERDEHKVTHATLRSWCEAYVAGRATEYSHTRSATESSVPLMAVDYGFLGRDTDVALATILVLIQRLQREFVRCFAKAQSLVQLTVRWHILTPGAWEKCCSRQATSLPSRRSLTRFGSNVMRGHWWNRVRSTRISRMVRSRMQCEGSRASRAPACVLQEKLGYKVDSERSILLPWFVRHAAYVFSRLAKRDDGRSAWARLRGKECDSPLAQQVGETVDFKIVRGEMAKLEPRTDESDEVIVGTAVGVEFARSFRRLWNIIQVRLAVERQQNSSTRHSPTHRNTFFRLLE